MKKLLLVLPFVIPLISSCNQSSNTKYGFTFIGSHCTLNNENEYEANSKIDLILSASEDEYMIPVELDDIRMGNNKLTKNVDYTYNYHTGQLLIPAIKGAVVVIANAVNEFYAVTFDMNNHDYTPLDHKMPKKQKIAYNDVAIAPIANKEYDPDIISLDQIRYYFKFWAKTPTSIEPYNFNEPVVSDITLYAIWDTYLPISISYNKNNDDFPTGGQWPDATIVHYKSKAIPPKESDYLHNFKNSELSKYYVFSHWSKTRFGDPYKFDEELEVSLELFAVWEVKNIYKVSFEMPSTYPAKYVRPSTKYIVEKEKVDSPKKDIEYIDRYVESGSHIYKFSCWTLEGTCFNFDSVITEDIKLVGYYEKINDMDPYIETDQ